MLPRKSWGSIANPLGLVLLTFTLALIPPALLSAWHGETYVWSAFANGAGVSLVSGIALWYLGRQRRGTLKAHDAYLLVALIWAVLAAIAALPVWLAIPGLSFTDAYFETTAGLTTSAVSTLPHPDLLPAGINLWRHELQWIGGLALLGLSTAVLPLLGIGGMQLYRGEAGGPIKDNRIGPRLRQTIRSLWPLYIALTCACVFALHWAGMSWFDAMCHALSTVSLGGFSSHAASIQAFASPTIEWVLIGFMLLAALNFTTHFAAVHRRSLRPYWMDAEARGMLLLLVGSGAACVAYLVTQGSYGSWSQALRPAVFQLVSLATGCGFHAADMQQWPLAVPLWLLLLSGITCSTGSCGGGIRMIRTLILFRQGRREIDRLMHPSAVQVVKIGGRLIPEPIVSSVLGFVLLYTASMLALTFLMILSGADFFTSFWAIAITLNNAGPGLGALGGPQGFAPLNDFQTWICTVSMLIGRMEVFILIVPLTPSFWRQ